MPGPRDRLTRAATAKIPTPGDVSRALTNVWPGAKALERHLAGGVKFPNPPRPRRQVTYLAGTRPPRKRGARTYTKGAGRPD